MTLSNLWFISIATLGEAQDFANWLEGKRKMFNDSMEFKEWLEAYKAFPLQIYLNGITYEFKDRNRADLFLMGFEAALYMKLDGI